MSKLKDRLDRVFSIYIRRRDCPDGYGKCISCGRAIAFSTCDAGHFIPRAHTATRWNTANVHAQCCDCNRAKGGNIRAYKKALAGRYGAQMVDTLEQKKHTTAKLLDRDYETLINFFIKQTTKP